jgi:hypothetical protein
MDATKTQMDVTVVTTDDVANLQFAQDIHDWIKRQYGVVSVNVQVGQISHVPAALFQPK